MKTDGSGNLAFATAGATLSNSDIADATTTVATSTTSVLNTFAVTTYRSAKYFISITDATNSRFEVVEANVTHDGSDAYITAFGSTTDHTGPLATLSADVSGGNVRLLTTNTSSDSCVFKFQRIAIDV
jgi:transketolase C-terminal domain/subunit